MYHQLLYSAAGIATQILIESPEVLILLDIGDGTLRDLLPMIKIPLDIPIHIFISHGHFDHCGGLFSLLGFFRMLGYNKKIDIYYPKGTTEVEGIIETFNCSYNCSIPFALELTPIENNKEKFLLENKITVQAYKMKHAGSILSHEPLPEILTFGYAIFEGDKKFLAYSGDTGMNENLVELINKAEFAYIEATNEKTQENTFHLNIDQARKLGKLSRQFNIIHTRLDKKSK
ncbi:MAG: ribonuclease Z [Candidatus Heimdallarchaeota archaeon]|nr:ribonuclease Z [Candidatus Heimdallarchaeota archaeon]